MITSKREDKKVALEDYMAEAERCSQCSYCKWIPMDQMKSVRYSRGCPSIAYNNFNSYSARGRYAVSLGLLRNKIEYSEKVKHITYQCCACGNCDVSCKVCRYNLEPLEMIREMRAKLVSDNQTLPQHEALISGLRTDNNLVMKPGSERGNWAEGLNAKRVTSQPAEVVFHAGCRFSYDEGLMSKARTAVELLKNAGVDVGILGEAETCCGGRAYDMGYREDFRRSASRNIETWKKLGIKTLVTSCSECYYAFKRLYPALGSQVKVLHTVEYLDNLIKEGRIKFSRNIPLKVTYHDPCHLGRRGEIYKEWHGPDKLMRPVKYKQTGKLGVFEPPRDILRAIPGITLVEMERIREYSWCCGAGGGVLEAEPAFAAWAAKDRLEEARDTGAEALVTACPWCERVFNDTATEDGDGLKVYNVTELLRLSLEGA
jgi:Fe-S oxidoreductase